MDVTRLFGDDTHQSLIFSFSEFSGCGDDFFRIPIINLKNANDRFFFFFQDFRYERKLEPIFLSFFLRVSIRVIHRIPMIVKLMIVLS